MPFDARLSLIVRLPVAAGVVLRKMPYTPLHMGPGMLLTAMSPRHFSIFAFGATQVLIDGEVLWNMGHLSHQLHTVFRTYLGAGLVALIAIPLSKAISGWARSIWNCAAQHISSFDMTVSGQTTWAAAILGACIGAFSHVLFDSFYHLDMAPFQPWSEAYPCRGIIDPFTMEVVFNALFILGLVWFTIRELVRKRAQHVPPGPRSPSDRKSGRC